MSKKNKRIIGLGSLRVWIFFCICILSVAAAVILKSGILYSINSQRIKLRQNDIQNQCLVISNHITDYGYLSNPSSEMINSEIAQLALTYSGRILILNSEFKIINDTFNLDVGKTDISPQAITAYRLNKPYTNYNAEHRLMELCLPIHDDEAPSKVVGLFMIAVSTYSLEEVLQEMNSKANIMMLIVIVIVIFFAFMMSTALTLPFSSLSANLKALIDGNGDEPLSGYHFKEARLLAEQFNTLYYRMKSVDESRQEFVSNVSHELKTPMASIKVLADSLMADENTPRELYLEFMKDITAEIDRENRIITDLLALVKLDKKAGGLDISSVNINEMIESLLKRIKPLADESHIDIVFESFRPIVAEVDELKLSQAVMNLVENAIKYNNEVGWVHVSVNSDHKYFYIKVSDNGMGIPSEALDLIFERFYRVDKSHSREISGTGLGLALTKSTINLHNGSIRVDSVLGDGTVFDIRIPLVYSTGKRK